MIDDNIFKSTAAGCGNLDYDPILQFIKSRKPYIHCILEDTKPDNAFGAKEYIESKYRDIKF